MKNQKVITYILGFLALVVLFLLVSSIYIVDETEQVVITQFGRPVGEPVTTAGLHLKLPFIQEANTFEKRLLEWDGIPTEISAQDKVFIEIDTYARWRIIDPLKLFRSVRNETGAQSRLDNIIDAATRDFVTSHILIEVVRSSNRKMEIIETELDIETRTKIDSISVGRSNISKGILEASKTKVLEYGIELVDVRIKRINYIQSVRQKVFDRMIAERLRIAEKYRSQGQGKKAEIEGDMEKELQKITSEAYRTAQEIKGKADAEAIRIYARAYDRDPEFYSFLNTLESYKKTIDENSTILLTTDNDYLKYLESISGQ
ncbi:protease modulator HflC [candidate division KSB1 bacterium]|nr:protease modulator HflC [candidate division KSB1 bacterium]